MGIVLQERINDSNEHVSGGFMSIGGVFGAHLWGFFCMGGLMIIFQ